MRKIILYAAVSVDDYISRTDGSIDWLNSPELMEEGEDFGYGKFYSTIDTTLMGHKTYKQVIGFDAAFPYPDKRNFVFTSKGELSQTNYVKFISGDIISFIEGLKEEEGKDIWLVGGGKLNTALLDAGLIDELILSKIPIPLGEGIPLFYDESWKEQFKSLSTKVFKNGILQIHLALNTEA